MAVGVGTLAGSTIMLLTIAWGGALLAGRCDLDENVRSLSQLRGAIAWHGMACLCVQTIRDLRHVV